MQKFKLFCVTIGLYPAGYDVSKEYFDKVGVILSNLSPGMTAEGVLQFIRRIRNFPSGVQNEHIKIFLKCISSGISRRKYIHSLEECN